MKVFLMFRDRDFDLEAAPPWNAVTLIQDLELEVLFNAMTMGDRFLGVVVPKAVLAGETDLETIRYRQAVLRDCLRNVDVVRAIFNVAIEANEGRRQHYWISTGRNPSLTLSGAVSLLEFYVGVLRKLRRVADEYASAFESDGFKTLFATLRRELSDDYFATVALHLRQLRFRQGVLISAALGSGNKGINYVLRETNQRALNWLERLFAQGSEQYSYRLHPRDESGARALSHLRDQGLNLVANAAAQAGDHIQSFFKLLQAELGFYVGCMNLYERLAEKNEPACFPDLAPPETRVHAFRGLYDVCLTLSMNERVVGNDLDAHGSAAVIITGANRGGKSVFLRSIGLAQLMMQCGMFVGAESFTANVCSGIFTHYKREEDASMESGKFDEELGRMSAIVDHVQPDALMLFNESFAATNDREGSEIARQIVSALLERRIKVFFVTHLYEFARALWEQHIGKPSFLRAERQPDGTRTYRLVEARPLQTSYGEDVYNEIFAG